MDGKMMDKDETEVLRNAFDLFDTNQSGAIHIKDLLKLFRYIGHDITDEEINQMMSSKDSDHKENQIKFNDFLALVSTKLNATTLANEAQIAETFKTFDRDNDGFITADEFKVTLRSLGEDLNDDMIKEMIDEVDLNGDGRIDYKEFTAMMLAK